VPRRLLVPVLAALLAVGCAAAPERPQERSDAVVVASFDFAESRLLGELYAQALEAAGVEVERELGLGPRELVLPAQRQGLVDVVPEYLSSSLAAVSGPELPAAGTPTSVEALHGRLQAALEPDGLLALAPSVAQNQNGLAVTRPTADRLRLETTSDLVAPAAELTLTGPPECPERPYCLQGLRQLYGLEFARFVPYDSESQRVTALVEGVVDVAVVFTTDARVVGSDLVLLVDDRGLQPAENVLPVVSARSVHVHGADLVATLDRVSAQLDSAALAFLNWRVEVAGRDLRDEARGWLLRRGLVAA
jgi:osmoprotectant transport system substrate-binding protein